MKMNGGMLEAFIPTRGLRQGDPLSPYLFLFIADGLATIFNREVRGGCISPVKVARNSPGISNLLFADDSLVFFKATREQARVVKGALSMFQKCTGQLLSSSKCSILFSEHCPNTLQEEIKEILACEASTFEGILGSFNPGRENERCKIPAHHGQISEKMQRLGWKTYVLCCEGGECEVGGPSSSDICHGGFQILGGFL